MPCSSYQPVRCYLLPPNGCSAAATESLAANPNVQQKTVYFCRHGRAKHNQAADEIGDSAYFDEAYFDAPLLEEGRSQALEAGVTLQGKDVQCIVTSPLTRCLQTAHLAGEGMGARKVVVEDLRESGKYGQHPCNRRRPVEEVAPRFPDFTFAELPEGEDAVWAHEEGKDGQGAMVQARASNFLEWLSKQPEETLAVFSHCVFLQQLLDEVLDMQPCTKNWQLDREYDGGSSWFHKG